MKKLISTKILKSIIFASKKHNGQFRADVYKSPYVLHPLHVTDILIKNGVTNEDIISATILHDTIEDTDTDFLEIAANFGIKVANYVLEVTDDKHLIKKIRRELQIERAKTLSRGAALIKVADKIHNISDIDFNTPTSWDEKRKLDYLIFCKKVVNNIEWKLSLKREFKTLFETNYYIRKK